MIHKLTLFSIFLLTSFTTKAQHTIEGKVVGFANGTKVYINKKGDDNFIKIDSTEILNNQFTFKSNITPEIDLYFIELGQTQEYLFPFIFEKGHIKFIFNQDKPSEAKVNGTKNNDLMTFYNEEAFKIQNEIIDFQQKNQSKFLEAQQKGDQETMESLMKEVGKIQEKYVDQNKNFISTHKNSYVSLLLLEQLALSDALTIGEIKKYYNDLETSIKNTKKGKEFAETLKEIETTQKENEVKQQQVAIGKKAPNFTANTPEGKTESLYKNLGKITIIDFWASWCGPCRKENPNMVVLYNKYKAQGLKIIGVSLDKDKNAWVNAIKNDELTWLQISNLKFWEDPIAKDYVVEAIPAIFILDANGIIIAKDLRGDELVKKLDELLTK